MTRIEFTTKIVKLLYEMLTSGEQFVIDYVLRSTEEQNRLFKEGKSKCDGINKKSAHQSGRAMDLYFIDSKGNLDFNTDKYEKWHKRWEEMGGKPMISWDKGHFE